MNWMALAVDGRSALRKLVASDALVASGERFAIRSSLGAVLLTQLRHAKPGGTK